LLFHQQVKLVEPPQYGAVLLLVIREGFPKPDECQSAFMFDGVAHEGSKGSLSGAKKEKRPSPLIRTLSFVIR
jgi:hypothetical protein